VLGASLVLVPSNKMFALHLGPGAFYKVIPYLAMVIPALTLFVYAICVWLNGGVQYWKETGGVLRRPGGLKALTTAIANAFGLRYLKGGGPGCFYPEERPSMARRMYHSLTFWGFLSAFLSTTLAAIYQEFFHRFPPYPLTSASVIFGSVGGVALIIGTGGLIWCKIRSDPAPAGAGKPGDGSKPGTGNGSGPQAGETDHIGAFAVTIEGIEPHIKRFEAAYDDYNKIILQALADRLAEAFTELLHEKVRKEFWGYVTEEHLTNEQLIQEEYMGIRPAPGYPACPDHTEKWKLFEMLDATRQTGIILTESLAMYPASSVSGWYFAHPESKYFGVGKIEKDQVEDYTARKGMPLEEIERWLRPVLEYDA